MTHVSNREIASMSSEALQDRLTELQEELLQLRAEQSLGGTPFITFWKVYFPLTIPGIGAGSLLVFILAIGYYITPELVGGASGTLISNQIAYHMKYSLDWSFASAMGLMLLAGVLAVYWVYNKLVGIDNIKLG